MKVCPLIEVWARRASRSGYAHTSRPCVAGPGGGFVGRCCCCEERADSTSCTRQSESVVSDTDNANTNTCRTRRHKIKLIVFSFGSNMSNSVIRVLPRQPSPNVYGMNTPTEVSSEFDINAADCDHRAFSSKAINRQAALWLSSSSSACPR